MEMHGSGRYRRNPAVSPLSAKIYYHGSAARIGERGGDEHFGRTRGHLSVEYAGRKSADLFPSECSSVTPPSPPSPPLVPSFQFVLPLTVRKLLYHACFPPVSRRLTVGACCKNLEESIVLNRYTYPLRWIDKNSLEFFPSSHAILPGMGKTDGRKFSRSNSKRWRERILFEATLDARARRRGKRGGRGKARERR